MLPDEQLTDKRRMKRDFRYACFEASVAKVLSYYSKVMCTNSNIQSLKLVYEGNDYSDFKVTRARCDKYTLHNKCYNISVSTFVYGRI